MTIVNVYDNKWVSEEEAINSDNNYTKHTCESFERIDTGDPDTYFDIEPEQLVWILMSAFKHTLD